MVLNIKSRKSGEVDSKLLTTHPGKVQAGRTKVEGRMREAVEVRSEAYLIGPSADVYGTEIPVLC